ncbi:MAG: DUF4252 domain-containing protein [Flavobacterium sp.]|nr:MAG: DUF4252 domain-containing protein [Flavobacterium sp.]
MKRFSSLAIAGLLLLVGCNSEPSLQKYFVEKSEDRNFISVDVSPTLLNFNEKTMTPEEKKSLEAFDKMNVLAFKLTDQNKQNFEAERAKVNAILKEDKYQQLMKFGRGKEGGSVSFVGDENHIDEVVVYANKNDAGFAVVRILGDNMNPTDIMNMITAIRNSDINLAQLKPLQEMMSQK